MTITANVRSISIVSNGGSPDRSTKEGKSDHSKSGIKRPGAMSYAVLFMATLCVSDFRLISLNASK